MLGHQLLEQLRRGLLDEQRGVSREELGELRRERRVGRHRHAPGGVAQEEAARAVHRVRLGKLAEGGGRPAVPDVEDGEVRLAVLAELDRELRGRRRLAVPERAGACRGEVVEPEALELLDQRGAVLAERQQHAAVRGVDAGLELLGRLALERAHEEVPLPLAGDDRADRAPAVRVAHPGEHVGARHEVGELRQQLLDQLRHARVRGHAPVLAAPVEPASRELLDGLVQVLVEGEVEDQLRLTRVVREEPDLTRCWDRLVMKRVNGQTVELSWDRGVRTALGCGDAR